MAMQPSGQIKWFWNEDTGSWVLEGVVE